MALFHAESARIVRQNVSRSPTTMRIAHEIENDIAEKLETKRCAEWILPHVKIRLYLEEDSMTQPA